MIAYCLKGISEVLAAQDDAESAARLLGVSDRLFDEVVAHVEEIERQTRERTVEHLQGVLGDDAFAAVHAEGQAMPLEHAVEWTLNVGGGGVRSDAASSRH